jgi:pimeloyl-ACP methyl ester carboxylesterase
MAIWPPCLIANRHTIHVLIFLSLGAVRLTGATPTFNSQHLGKISSSTLNDLQQRFRSSVQILAALTREQYVRAISGQLGAWDMVQLIAACTLIGAFRLWKQRRTAPQENSKAAKFLGGDTRKSLDSTRASSQRLNRSSKSGESATLPVVKFAGAQRCVIDPGLDAENTDPGLLRKHSSIKSYTTSTATYPSIRTFYRPHPQVDKLPTKPTPLPLLVFVHGIGGSLAQFHHLLTSLVNIAPCLGIDLPGCGLSEFSPSAWNCYTAEALVELLAKVIEEHCDNEAKQGVILVGHSMGCSLSALLASSTSGVQAKGIDVLALIAICPRAAPPTAEQVATYQRLLRVPTPIFDIWRSWDRRGGPESVSVARFVGLSADIETKKLQARFNTQSRTAVWRRMAWGALPIYRAGTVAHGGLPGLEVWAGLAMPLFLVGGEADNITKPEEIAKIGRALGRIDKSPVGILNSTTETPAISTIPPGDTGDGKLEPASGDNDQKQSTSNTETTIIRGSEEPNGQITDGQPTFTKRRQVLKTSILPSPASHALLYDPATYRTLAGLIQTFLYEHVDSRLSLGWQLQHLSTEGKWDVKNLAKWQAVRPVSEPIAGIFRAMKTLREIDDTHSPDIFVKSWRGRIKAVIDISHESPVYDPKALDQGGIEYNKFPTVSKIPPTAEEVHDFIKLVDRLRSKPPSSSPPTPSTLPPSTSTLAPLIGVHCHYGFNRTGFFICAYLIEKEGFGVQQAIDLFQEKRPPGIRHEHFLDTLFVRYCVGLRRAPTF